MQVHLAGTQRDEEVSILSATFPVGSDCGHPIYTCDDKSAPPLEGSQAATSGKESFLLDAGHTCSALRSLPHRSRRTGDVPARNLLIHNKRRFDEFLRIAGIPAGQDAPPSDFPREAQAQKPLAHAARFGGRILAPPELRECM